MTRITPILTSLKTLNITYKTPRETLLATPEPLVTAEPETGQVYYTVAEADLPTFNMAVYSKKWVAVLVAGGKNAGDSAVTVYYRMKKNGVSVSTGSVSVSAGYYYTIMCFFYDVAVGDTLEISLWANLTGANWDYEAFQIQVTRLILFNKPRLLLPCNFESLATQPVLTLGNPYLVTSDALAPQHLDKSLPVISAATSYESLYPKSANGLFRIYNGDSGYANSGRTRTDSTYRPSYYRNYVPTQIIMRGVRGIVEP
jgi:hypothetical protein